MIQILKRGSNTIKLSQVLLSFDLGPIFNYRKCHIGMNSTVKQHRSESKDVTTNHI